MIFSDIRHAQREDRLLVLHAHASEKLDPGVRGAAPDEVSILQTVLPLHGVDEALSEFSACLLRDEDLP